MRIIKPLNVGTLTKHHVQDGKFWLDVGAAYFFDLNDPDVPLSEQEMWGMVPGELAPSATFDEGRPKARGEVLLSGRCFAPGGAAAAASQVSLEIGPPEGARAKDRCDTVIKGLAVYGDRFWLPQDDGEGWRPSEPVPFTEMDLKPETSFGGEGLGENPHGKGYLAPDAELDPAGTTPLANLQAPGATVAGPGEPQQPAGFWPLGLKHPGRLARFGTCDQRWADEVFPEDPRDTDPTFYNMAPADQQIDGFWRGDETFVLANMHPAKPRLEGRICGVRTRCFVTAAGGWREVPMAVETVWLFPHEERGVLIHRGSTEIGTFTGTDVEHLVLAYELFGGESRPAAAYKAAVANRLNEATALEFLARQDDLSPPEVALALEQARQAASAVDAEEEAEPLPPMVDAQLARARQQAEEELDDARAVAAGAGVDLDGLMEQAHQESLDRNKEHLDEMMPLLSDIGVQVDLDDFRPDRAREMKGGPRLDLKMPKVKSIADAGPAVAFLQGLQTKLDLLEQKMGSMAENLNAEAQKQQDSEEASARSLAADAGLDFDQLTAAAHAEARTAAPDAFAELEAARGLVKDDPEQLAKLDKAGIKLEAARGDLEKAQSFAGGANPALDPELGPLLREVLHHAPKPEPPAEEVQAAARQSLDAAGASGTAPDHMDFTGVSLAGIKLPGATLRGAVMTGADLSGADLSGADLSGAILAHADLSGAILAGAVLAGASLGKAKLASADLSEADLSEAIISGADFSGADLSGADLSGIDLVQETTFVEADLSGAKAPELYVLECDFSRANLAGADLQKTTVLRSTLEEADLSGANLTSLQLVKVQARGCKMIGATAPHLATALGSDLTGADFAGADLSMANFRQATLAGASFAQAKLDRADFGEADLSRAKLVGASAVQARFIGADLTDACLQQTNFMGASLMGASLTRADMRGCQLFDTNALFAQCQGVLLEGARITRSKLQQYAEQEQG